MPSSSISAVIQDKHDDMDRYDPEWVVFVRDHLAKLRRTAQIRDILPETIYHRAYRPDLLILQSDSGRVPMWITLMLNRLSSEEEFYNLREPMLVPERDELKKLYNAYTTVRKNRVKALKELTGQ